MCTAIMIAEQGFPVLGFNYDFYFDDAVLTMNPPGLGKRAIGDPAFRWMSTHASACINQFGCEFPSDGMNDAGLVVLAMECEGSVSPQPTGKQALMDLQWVQYLLDTTTSVEEALASLKCLDIEKTFFSLHFIIADPVEYAILSPNARGYEILRQPFTVSGALTNTPLGVARKHVPGTEAPGTSCFIEHFHIVSRWARQWQGQERATDYVSAALDEAAERPEGWQNIIDHPNAPGEEPILTTICQAVFLPAEARVMLRTRADPRLKVLSLKELHEMPETVLLWNMKGQACGDLRAWMKPYDRAVNEEQIRRAFTPFRKLLPEEAHQYIIDLAEELYAA